MIASERGATVVFFLIVVLSILGFMTTLVVDLSRAEYVHTRLQGISDSAALAAVNQLRYSSKDGWRRSKRAVFASMRQLDIPGHNGAVNSPGNLGVALNAAHADPLEISGSPYVAPGYQIGNLRVEITRGYLGPIDSGSGVGCDTIGFHSLEIADLGAVTTTAIEGFEPVGKSICGGQGAGSGAQCNVEWLTLH